MIRDKQIAEMADDIRRIRESYFGQADYLFAMKMYEDGYRKAPDVAPEIFAEIDRMCIDTFGNFNHRVFAELKKKYIGKDTNVTTKESE